MYPSEDDHIFSQTWKCAGTKQFINDAVYQTQANNSMLSFVHKPQPFEFRGLLELS
jgi:hypothetical protein